MSWEDRKGNVSVVFYTVYNTSQNTSTCSLTYSLHFLSHADVYRQAGKNLIHLNNISWQNMTHMVLRDADERF